MKQRIRAESDRKRDDTASAGDRTNHIRHPDRGDRETGGDPESSAEGIGGAVQRAQRRFGNQAVERALARDGGEAAGGRSNGGRDGERLESAVVPSRSFDALGDGQRLSASTRSKFEPLFGFDLSGVRLHTDGFGVRAARAMGVPAFAVGRDVVVRPDRANPRRGGGNSTLAHELAHVVQQGRSSGQTASRAAAERDATAAGNAAAHSRPAQVRAATDLRIAPQGYTGSHAISPEDMFEILKSWRGHRVRSGAGFVTWDRLSMDVEASSQMLGRGDSTTAMISVSDASGNQQIIHGVGISDGTGHAEVNAIGEIKNRVRNDPGLRSQLRGAHAMVVVDQTVCADCRRRLRRFVTRHGMAGVTAVTFSREKLVGSGQASPKTSMHGTTRNYTRETGPFRRQVDFAYGNAHAADGARESRTGLRQGELFDDRRNRQSAGSVPASRRSTHAATGASGSHDSSPFPDTQRQLTLFQYARRMSSESGSHISAPPTSLLPSVRFVRFAVRVSNLAEGFTAVTTLIESLDMAHALAAGEVAILTELEERLLDRRSRIEAFADRYDDYSGDLRLLERTLADVANSGDLDAIWETELDVRRIHRGIRGHRNRLEIQLLPRLQAAKETLLARRRLVEAAMGNRTFVSLVGAGGSTAPLAKLVAFRQDLIKLNGILTRTVSAVEGTIEQMERDEEFLITWVDWLGQVWVHTRRDQEAQSDD